MPLPDAAYALNTAAFWSEPLEPRMRSLAAADPATPMPTLPLKVGEANGAFNARSATRLVTPLWAMAGMSSATKARKVGAAAAPLAGPPKIRFCAWVMAAKVNAGVVVAVASAVVNRGEKSPALKLVTVPTVVE